MPLTRPDYAHDVDAMADAFTDRTRLVFIANPHNLTQANRVTMTTKKPEN